MSEIAKPWPWHPGDGEPEAGANNPTGEQPAEKPWPSHASDGQPEPSNFN